MNLMLSKVMLKLKIRLKKNIEFYYEGLNKINQIQVKNYEYKTKEEVIDSLKLSVIERKGIQIGVIAQEIKEVLPEVVMEREGEDQFMSVSYGNIVGVLIEAIKELKAEIEELKGQK